VTGALSSDLLLYARAHPAGFNNPDNSHPIVASADTDISRLPMPTDKWDGLNAI
jgi:hypothetical protein